MNSLKNAFYAVADLSYLAKASLPIQHPGRAKLSLTAKLFSLHLKKKLWPRTRNVRETIAGITITAFDRWTMTYLFHEIFIRGSYFVELPKIAAPTIIDIGGNIGTATLYLKWLYPQSTVYTFEPDPTTFAQLQKNIQDNNTTKVHLENAAVSNAEGTISFYVGEQEEGSLLMSIRPGRMESGKSISVKTVQLSSYLKQKGITKVDLLKIDAEGAEWEIVDDLIQSGAIGSIQRLVVEYHHHVGNEASRLSKFLDIFEKAGFKYQIQADFFPISREHKFEDILLYFYRP